MCGKYSVKAVLCAQIKFCTFAPLFYLCCLAHVRAKLERAERMGCKEASSPMSKIRKLYKREDLYVEKGYDAEKNQGDAQ